MADRNRIYIEVDIDSKAAATQVAQINKQIESMGKAAQQSAVGLQAASKAITQVERDMRKLATDQQKLHTQFVAIGRANQSYATSTATLTTNIRSLNTAVRTLVNNLTRANTVTQATASTQTTTARAVQHTTQIIGQQTNTIIRNTNVQRQQAQQQAQSAAMFRQGVGNLQAVTAALGMSKLTDQVVESAKSFDQWQRMLQASLKPGEDAVAMFDRLEKVALKPGLSLEGVINTFARLKPAIQDSELIISFIQELGNALAAMGKGGDVMTRIGVQFSQMAGRGKIAMDDLRIIIAEVPQINSIMLKLWGTMDTEQLQQGGTTVREFFEGIIGEMQKMERVAPGVIDTFDNMGDAITRSLGPIGKDVLNNLKPAFDAVSGMLREISTTWQSMPKEMQAVISWLVGLGIVGMTAVIAAIISPTVTMVLAGIVLSLTSIVDLARKWQKGMQFRKDLFIGEIDKMDYTDQWNYWYSGEKPQRLTPEELKAKGPQLPMMMSPEVFDEKRRQREAREQEDREKEAKKAAQEAIQLRKMMVDAEREARSALRDAIADRTKGLAEFGTAEQQLAVALEAQNLAMDRRQQEITERMAESKIKPSREMLGNWEQERIIRRGIIEDKYRQEQIEKNKKMLADYSEAWVKAEEDTMRLRAEIWLEYRRIAEDVNQREIDEYNRVRSRDIESARDAQLEALDQQETRTLDQQLAVAQQRYEIEREFVDKMLVENLRLLEADRQRELSALRLKATLDKMIDSPEYKQAVQATEDFYAVRREGLQGDANEKRELERLKNISNQSQMVRAEMQKTFDYFQRLGEGVFDALLDKSKSVWQSMADFFKITVLTMLKAVFTSIIANSMMRLFFGGQGAGAGPRSQTRTGGGLGSILSNVFGNVFGGGGGGGSSVGETGDRNSGSGGFGLRGWLQRITGGPGGTSGFSGPVSYATSPAGVSSRVSLADLAIWDAAQRTQGAGIPTGGAQGGLAGILGKMGGGFKSDAMNGLFAMAGLGMAVQGFGQKGVMGNVNRAGGAGMAAYGLAGKQLGILGSAGVGLAYNGMVQGGWKGLAQTTAGGAMIGFQFGGPLGAAIGAGIGAAAGGIRMLFKGASEKTRERIKQIYGIDIQSQQIIGQIVQIAKTQYGGDMNVALYSPAVRELIQLYGLSQGTSVTKGIGRPMYGVSWGLSGGAATMQPVYSSGSLVTNPYVGPTTAQMAGGGTVLVQLQPEAANSLLEGKVVSILDKNAPAVADASTSALDANYRRTRERNALLEPMTLLA